MGLPCSQSCISAAFLNVASLTLTLLHTLRQGQQMLLQGFQAHKQHQPTYPSIRILRLDRPYAYSSKNDFDVVSWWNVAGSCAWLPASLPHSQLRPPSTSRVTPSPNNQCCRNRVSYPENLFGWNWLRKILHRHSFIKFPRNKSLLEQLLPPEFCTVVQLVLWKHSWAEQRRLRRDLQRDLAATSVTPKLTSYVCNLFRQNLQQIDFEPTCEIHMILSFSESFAAGREMSAKKCQNCGSTEIESDTTRFSDINLENCETGMLKRKYPTQLLS